MLGMTVCFSTLWRFPYQTVNFGGGGFVLIYLIVALLFVYPALTAEWGLGRLTGRGPDGAFKNVKLPANKAVSVFLLGVVFAIGSYFAIWIGWIVRYAYSSIFDSRLSKSSTDSASYFDNEVAANPFSQLFFAALVILFVAPIVIGGQKKIQTASNRIVPIFYVTIIIMSVIILIQPGVFSATFSYLTTVNTAEITSYTFITALGQAFFSLCLGGTFMVLYGSYMDRKKTHNIPINAGYTVFGNTLASIISVVLIIGIVNFANIDSDLTLFGPGLFFGLIPEAFQALDMNINIIRIGLVIFFVMFFFAAYLPMTAIIEVQTVALVDQFGWSRQRSYALVAVSTLLFAIPSAISPHSGGFLYNLDIFVGAMGLIVGSIIAIVAFTWYVPKNTVLKEVNAESRFKLGKIWYAWTKYVTPSFMIMIVLYVLSDVLSGVAGGLYGVEDRDYLLYRNVVDITPIIFGFVVVSSVILYLKDKTKTSKIVVTT
jgi:NSS family neurotransmitter:Na+ symporter